MKFGLAMLDPNDRSKVAKRLKEKNLTLVMTDEAKELLIERGTSLEFGARPLRRAVERYIEDPLSEALIQGTIKTRPAFIEVYLEGDRLFYRPVGSEDTEGILLYSN